MLFFFFLNLQKKHYIYREMGVDDFFVGYMYIYELIKTGLMGGWGGKLGSQMNISNSRAAGLVFIWVVPLFSSFFICLSGRPLYDLFFNIFPLMKMDKFFLIRMIIIMGKKRKRREKRGGREREKRRKKKKERKKREGGDLLDLGVFVVFAL